MPTAKERTTHYLTVEFRDKAGAPAVPSTASYRIDCMTTGTAIRPETALTPASSIEITLTPDDLRIVSDGNRIEKRLVTVKSTYGAGDEVNDDYEIEVRNLKFVP